MLSALYFLIGSLFSLMILIIWLRILIRYFSISPFHPLSQSIYKITMPVMGPIQKKLTAYPWANGRYDVASLIVLVGVTYLKFFVMSLLAFYDFLPLGYSILFVITDMIIQPCNIMFYTILLRVILSWVSPGGQNPFFELIFLVTEPLLSHIRRYLPDTGLLDFSPLVALLGLKAIVIMVSNQLPFVI